MRKKKEFEENDEPSAPFWMLTYSDMVTLLLTFFVLLISFSNMDEAKFEQAAHSLKGALGILKQYPSPRNKLGLYLENQEMQQREEIIDNVTELQRKAKELQMAEDINIQVTDNGLLIQLGDKILFDVGNAELKPNAHPLLDIVGKTIRKHARTVLVSGHTDNIPIKTPQYPSNWELSSARAISVVKYLIDYDGVPPELLAATAFSEYKPIVPNTTPENQRKNRRVEFLVTWK
jgi:chemotaxis protein MotB